MQTAGSFENLSDLKRRVGNLGAILDMQVFEATMALYQPLHASVSTSDIRKFSDLSYGPDPRHRLNIFTAGRGEALPVLAFVHGGGFVGGNTTIPGTRFFDNIGHFAAENGMVGVNLTHRLAPAHRAPAATDDLARAVEWIVGEIGAYGGDPEKIILMGSSAGATNIAALLGHAASYFPGRLPFAGAILRSGVFDLAALPAGFLRDAYVSYFGEDEAQYRKQIPLDVIGSLPIPMALVIAEHDPPMLREQSLAMMGILAGPAGADRQLLYLHGHNHFSIDFASNTVDNAVDNFILDFVAGCMGSR